MENSDAIERVVYLQALQEVANISTSGSLNINEISRRKDKEKAANWSLEELNKFIDAMHNLIRKYILKYHKENLKVHKLEKEIERLKTTEYN